MEANRLELSDLLQKVSADAGEHINLYHQPPENVKLEYPCIIYKLDNMPSNYADDRPYITTISYELTYITRSPVSEVPANLVKVPKMAFDRYYVYENLHHYTYKYTCTLKEEIND